MRRVAALAAHEARVAQQERERRPGAPIVPAPEGDSAEFLELEIVDDTVLD